MAIFFPRSIGPVYVDVVVSEEAEASMEIPTHPVERGAKISDHAWRLPTTLKMECLCQDLAGPWQAMKSLMALAEPFDILTGFDLFENMMIERIEPRRDAVFCNILSFTVSFKEIIIVQADQGGVSSFGGDERGLGAFVRGTVATTLINTAVGRGASLAASLVRF